MLFSLLLIMDHKNVRDVLRVLCNQVQPKSSRSTATIRRHRGTNRLICKDKDIILQE